MVYYCVKEDAIGKIDEDNFWGCQDGICILTVKQWNEEKEWKQKFHIWQDVENIHFCKMESHRDYLYGTFRIPAKSKKKPGMEFAMFIKEGRIILLEQYGNIEKNVKKAASRALKNEYSLERFLYDFLESFLDGDLLFLEQVEQEISHIEEDVLRGKAEQYSYRMLYLKKEIARFYHYYSQLMDIAQELLCNVENFFGKEDLQMFRMYGDKVSRLAQETQLLREYAMQVQDVYQSEIGIHQNDVMKMLTVVTTIFLPLTLIAGWYGMNFSHMPELSYKYGYPVIIIISVLIVLISLIIFKKKKYW